MRFSIVCLATIAGFLLAGSALAAEGNRGGEGPGNSGGGPTGGLGGQAEHADADMHARESRVVGKEGERKKWQLEAVWETHRMIRQEDVEGYAVNKTVNAAFLYARYDITKNNRLWLRGGVYERFISDDEETGFRTDDLVAAYRRLFPLPQKFTASATFQLSAPTSFASQKEGLITEPRLTLGVDKEIGPLTVIFRTYGAVHWMRYTTAQGGAANPKWVYLASLGLELKIPYLEVITLGTSLTEAYSWLYEPGYVQNAPNSQRYGVSEDPNYGNKQPVQQSYGWEIYARYNAPVLAGFKSDLTVSYTQGDPTLGYTSALHDGSRHVYPLYWRQTSTVYAALSVAY
jgi:hypothetical protein